MTKHPGYNDDVNRKTLYFTAPGQVEIREELLPGPGAHDVLVETLCSAISAGTEMLIYQGRFPRDLEADSAISGLRGGFKYPLAYGYANAGVVREIGEEVDPSWQGKHVFSFQPHTSHYLCRPDSLTTIPSPLSPETACFLPNMETAVNLVQDGAPVLGERVLVLGQGVVGLFTTSLLSEFPLDTLVIVDRFDLRCQMGMAECQKSKASSCALINPGTEDYKKQAFLSLKQGADLSFELSGNPAALNDAIKLTRFSGRVVIGSWYGEKKAEIDLGSSFHRSRIKLISSQVSTLSPELSGRWDKQRRFDVAWKALERIQPEKWITHRFTLGQAADAYHLLDQNPQEALQVILEYKP
jgi:2-desacetyl-2-hydroxyethyl bacteriochlorophyllide A dehydrogenase